MQSKTKPKTIKPKEDDKEQSARFRAEVERLISAGELNPKEADRALDNLVRMRSGGKR